MAALAADLSPYLLRVAELGFKLAQEGDKTSFYKLHKETADRILACHPSQYSEILNVKKPTTQAAVVAAFSVLSMLLCPEGNIGSQYELAQEAHDWVWKATKSFGVDMSEFYGNNETPPSFSGNSRSAHVDSEPTTTEHEGSSGMDSLTAPHHTQRIMGPPAWKGSPSKSAKSDKDSRVLEET